MPRQRLGLVLVCAAIIVLAVAAPISNGLTALVVALAAIGCLMIDE